MESSELEVIYRERNLLNLEGITVIATAPEGNLTQGEIIFETLPNQELRFSDGFGVTILYSLQIALGFQIKVKTALGWATQYPNGSWFGMAQQVIDGEADFAIAKTSILPNRAQALGYLQPIHGLGLYAFFIQPSSGAARNIFLDPFPLPLWLSILGIYCLIILSISLIPQLTSSIHDNPQDSSFVQEVWLWSFHTLCQHGYHSPPSKSSLRVGFFSGIILGLFLYLSYSAQLVSIFSIVTPPIKDIGGLLSSSLSIVIDANNARATGILSSLYSSDPVAHRLKDHLKKQRNQSYLAPAADGGLFVLRGQGAYVSFSDSFYSTTKNNYGTKDDEFCAKVASVLVTDAKSRSGLFVKKGSRFKEPFNVKLISMFNSGLMSRLVANYERTYAPTCEKEPLIKSIPVIEFGDVGAAFFGIAFALGSTFLMLLLEILFERKTRLSAINNVQKFY